jgi:hypothetical protein
MNQLASMNGAPLVGGLLGNCKMSAGNDGAKTFPLENSACGISTEPRAPTPVTQQPTYWLKVDNSKRQCKWKKVYFDDDE